MNDPMLRTASFNIRYDIYGGEVSDKNKERFATKGETPWEVRRTKVVDTILFHRIDLIGIQVKLNP